ncbi:MAG: hypothetical protein ACOVSW_15285 [Candidatus Kapaibacteriota bacterium]
MNPRILICLLGVILTSSACTPPTQQSAITPAFDENRLFKTWYFDWTATAIFSDSQKKSYRAEGYSLPPARGRTGLKFEPKGKYTYIGIAPADGELPFAGSWKWITPTTVRVRREAKSFQGASWEAEEASLEILTVNDSTLVVRWLP